MIKQKISCRRRSPFFSVSFDNIDFGMFLLLRVLTRIVMISQEIESLRFLESGHNWSLRLENEIVKLDIAFKLNLFYCRFRNYQLIIISGCLQMEMLNMTLIKYDTFIRGWNPTTTTKKRDEQRKIITQRSPEKDHKIRLILENEKSRTESSSHVCSEQVLCLSFSVSFFLGAISKPFSFSFRFLC